MIFVFRVAKAEMLLQDDGEVSKLEEECNWFRNETNRLQTHSAAMQHDIQALKTRFTALRDQNQYLSSQLKAVMKRSRVLEVNELFELFFFNNSHCLG